MRNDFLLFSIFRFVDYQKITFTSQPCDLLITHGTLLTLHVRAQAIVVVIYSGNSIKSEEDSDQLTRGMHLKMLRKNKEIIMFSKKRGDN